MFEYATGIICRGYKHHPRLSDGMLVAVKTHGVDEHDDRVRIARVRVKPANGFVAVHGPAEDDEYDWLFAWEDSDVDPDSLQAVLIGGRTHYTVAR